MSFEKGQNINSSAEEPEKKVRRIVIASVDIEGQARDIAEEKMLSSKAELKGFRGFFAKIWKHNLAHEYYRQKEIATARREIKESGNLYAGEKGEKEDHENAMNAIVQRFQVEYEGENLLRKGEEKKTLKNDDPSAPRLKNEISDLIKRFASGNLSEEQFQIEKKNIYGEHAPDAKNVSVFADNLLEIAKQVKDSIAHGKGLDALDEDYEIVVGKARAGVETEAQYNAVDRITEKIQKSFIGKFINEATVASAVAIAYGAIAKGVVSAAHRGAKLVGPLGMGLSAGIGGAVAGVRENKRIKEQRAQHGREMAKGKQIESGSKSREEMEKFRYETRNANELSGNLKEALEGLKTQPSEQKLHAVLEHLNEINSRLTFSEQEKIDLVSFSDSKDVEKERTNMYIAVAEAKVYLKRNIHADWATFYNNEQQLNEYLQHVKETKIQKDFIGEKTLKDEAFNKMKRKKVALAVTKGLGIGLGVGMAAQEIGASFGNGKDGLFGATNASGQDQHYTALNYLRHYVAGDLPHDEISQNISHNIASAGLPVHEISSHEAVVSTKDFVKEHESMFSKIHRGAWADNNSAKTAGNALKLWWGGDEGTGIDKNGNYVFNIKHMTSEGSFHGGKHWDPQELMKAGKMKLLLSLSGDTQNQVIEIPIDANGNAIIDPNSEIGKLAFANADGQAKFLGKFAEVAVMGEKVDGVEHVNVLATHLGKGIDSLKTIITDEHEKIIPPISVPGENINPVGYDVDSPFVIPIAGRKPMEQLEQRRFSNNTREYYYGSGGDYGLLARDKYRDRMSKSILENKNIDLSMNDSAVIAEYFEKQDEKYMKELSDMIKNVEPMDKNVQISITVPSYQEGDNLEKTLRAYAKMKNRAIFEIVIFENHPRNKERDNTPEVIEKIKKEFSDMKIVHLYKVFDEKPAIGEVRKYLVDSVLLRKQKTGVDKSIGIISNDADLENIDENYAVNMAEAFERNTKVDAIGAKWDFPVDAFKQYPLLHASQRLWYYLDIAFRNYYLKSPELIGRNSAFRSGIYAAVGGYNKTSQLAEDLEIGWLIKEARGYDIDRIVYNNKASLVSNPRRAVTKLLSGGRLIQQYGDFHVNEDVRKASLGKLLEVKREMVIDDLQKEIQAIYDHYSNWKKTKNGWIDDNYIDKSFDRAMRFLGVDYRINNEKIELKDVTKLFSGLKKDSINIDIENTARQYPKELKAEQQVTMHSQTSESIPVPETITASVPKIEIEQVEMVQQEYQTPIGQATSIKLDKSENLTQILKVAPQMPLINILEKFDQVAIEKELRKIKTDFGVDIQGDQIIGEDNNKEIIQNLRDALFIVGKQKIENIKIIGLQKSLSRIVGKGDMIRLQYSLSPVEMVTEIDKLISESIKKQEDKFDENQFSKEISAKSGDLFNHLKKQMRNKNIPIEVQLNFMEIVAKAKLKDEMVDALKTVKFSFVMISEKRNFPNGISDIRENARGEIEIIFGSEEYDYQDIKSLGGNLRRTLMTM